MWTDRRTNFPGFRWMVSLLIGGFAVAFSASPAAAVESPTDFIKKHSKEVTELLSQDESPGRAEKFSEKAHNLIDFRTLASRALEGHWEERSDAEQEKFLELLQKLLEANYKKKLEGYELGEDYEIKYLEEKQRDDRALVSTKVIWGNSEKKRKPVKYKMMKQEGDWIIYDVVVDGASLEQTYRDAYTEIIRKDGWDTLIEKMKQKIEKLRAKSG